MIIHGPYEQSAESRAERAERISAHDAQQRRKATAAARNALLLWFALTLILLALWRATA